MHASSSESDRPRQHPRVAVTKTDNGWAIRYLEDDPVARYAPLTEREVEKAIERVRDNETVEI